MKLLIMQFPPISRLIIIIIVIIITTEHTGVVVTLYI
jgi:hypothetical protein